MIFAHSAFHWNICDSEDYSEGSGLLCKALVNRLDCVQIGVSEQTDWNHWKRTDWIAENLDHPEILRMMGEDPRIVVDALEVLAELGDDPNYSNILAMCVDRVFHRDPRFWDPPKPLWDYFTSSDGDPPEVKQSVLRKLFTLTKPSATEDWVWRITDEEDGVHQPIGGVASANMVSGCVSCVAMITPPSRT